MPAELQGERDVGGLCRLVRGPVAGDLTARELEILRYVARGLKLHLRDRVQAVVFAYENGVVARGAS